MCLYICVYLCLHGLCVKGRWEKDKHDITTYFSYGSPWREVCPVQRWQEAPVKLLVLPFKKSSMTSLLLCASTLIQSNMTRSFTVKPNQSWKLRNVLSFKSIEIQKALYLSIQNMSFQGWISLAAMKLKGWSRGVNNNLSLRRYAHVLPSVRLLSLWCVLHTKAESVCKNGHLD